MTYTQFWNLVRERKVDTVRRSVLVLPGRCMVPAPAVATPACLLVLVLVLHAASAALAVRLPQLRRLSPVPPSRAAELCLPPLLPLPPPPGQVHG